MVETSSGARTVRARWVTSVSCAPVSGWDIAMQATGRRHGSRVVGARGSSATVGDPAAHSELMIIPLSDRITIRRFSTADAEAVTAVLHEAYAPLAQRGLRYVATYQDVPWTMHRASCGRAASWVAEHDGRVVGTIALYPWPHSNAAPAFYRGKRVAVLGQFGVQPTLQRHRVGSQLAAAAEEHALRLGADYLALDTSEHATDLIELYERHGFEVVDEVDWQITNYRSVVMAKRLWPDAGTRATMDPPPTSETSTVRRFDGDDPMRSRWPRSSATLDVDASSAQELLAPWDPTAQIVDIAPVAGGLGNTNLRVHLTSGEHVVLRLYTARPTRAEVEIAVARRHGERLGIPEVLFYAEESAFGCPYALTRHIAADRLETHPSARENGAEVGHLVGERLAAIHSVRFETYGPLDASLEVAQRYALAAEDYADVLRDVANDRAHQRLGDALEAGIGVAVERMAQIRCGTHEPCLSHGDFGGSNILLGPRLAPSALWVVDWEFAMAAHQWFDIGNLLRPPLGDLEGFVGGFAEGYRGGGGVLCPCWRSLARLWDLVAWVQLAGREACNDALIQDVRAALASAGTD